MPVPSLGKSAPRGAELNVEAMLPPQSSEEAERERSAAAQLRGVLEARLRDVHEGRLAPGQRGFYELYRSVVAHPHWLVPGSLHRDRSINTLFTFSRNERDRGILPVFSSRPEFAKFLQLMRTTAAASPGYQSECFEMPGHLLFAQLALAVHRTNLERVVVDITVAPSFSIAKDKLDTWREWADVISLEQILSRAAAVPPGSSGWRVESERALTAVLQFRHFIAVKNAATERLTRLAPAAGSEAADAYLALYTAVDRVPAPLLDKQRFQLVRAPARQALESCAKHGHAGLALNPGDTLAAGAAPLTPLAVLSVKDGRASAIEPPAARTWLHITE